MDDGVKIEFKRPWQIVDEGFEGTVGADTLHKWQQRRFNRTVLRGNATAVLHAEL
jgi:hypothetical protein